MWILPANLALEGNYTQLFGSEYDLMLDLFKEQLASSIGVTNEELWDVYAYSGKRFYNCSS